MPPSIVFIGPADALAGVRERMNTGIELHTFTDAQALEALDHIVKHKPRIIVLDPDFSTSTRGTALANRIKEDPELKQCEVRVIAYDRVPSRSGVRRPPAGQSSAVAVDEPKPVVEEPKPPIEPPNTLSARPPAVKEPPPIAELKPAEEPKPSLDFHGTRRAPRIPIRDGVEIAVDGNTATLVDLSTVGAQVLTPGSLRPNQRVRVVFADAAGALRYNGSIAWASLELPKGLPPRYRAGIDMTGANAEAVKAFANRYKKD